MAGEKPEGGEDLTGNPGETGRAGAARRQGVHPCPGGSGRGEPREADVPVRKSPCHSGHGTPAALSPGHLQQIRGQMAAALRQLKGLEEQVKVIPALEETISQLRKEKEALAVGWRGKPDPGAEDPPIFASHQGLLSGLRKGRPQRKGMPKGGRGPAKSPG
ncbi:hypothetical protein JRQ81_008703 [Phrynocephalus forsythii]|uniref:Uncharacterized protein n=1 Tax=Phrynocephalus forsythii TaxID=171643 RepID=A0A9Q0XBH3_9SAUR|nr:hypothetical protein JRQ81_008703 [Phrynocephalus forsythii]